jgi:NAD(P)-dependent dehydrogenase (short-subunit alcohol dehydrogenase family)
MRGKICMVTGANSGIGRETARQLAALGATVVMVCREQATGQEALNDIRKTTKSDSLELMTADLSSQAAIRQLADEFTRQHDQLHVLINNAGVMRTNYTETVDGYEMTFAVNHLAPFLLTHLLLDALKAGAPSRVVAIMGNSGPINFDDLMGKKHYDSMKAYQQSKTANRLFAAELAKRLDGTGVTSNGADPGFVRTNLGRDAQGSFKAFLLAARPTMRSPESAAEVPVYVGSSPELDGVTGKLFADKKGRGTPASQGGSDDTNARRLWQVSAELTGIGA